MAGNETLRTIDCSLLELECIAEETEAVLPVGPYVAEPLSALRCSWPELEASRSAQLKL